MKHLLELISSKPMSPGADLYALIEMWHQTTNLKVVKRTDHVDLGFTQAGGMKTHVCKNVRQSPK